MRRLLRVNWKLQNTSHGSCTTYTSCQSKMSSGRRRSGASRMRSLQHSRSWSRSLNSRRQQSSESSWKLAFRSCSKVHLAVPAGPPAYTLKDPFGVHIGVGMGGYRSEVVQPVLVTLMLFQVVSGVILFWRASVTRSDLYRTHQTSTGGVLNCIHCVALQRCLHFGACRHLR